jgi:GrpB-like predicted nucleotidyltransferase (UPF0157 family)
MLTKSQQKWIDHLKDDDRIIIKPYDPKSPEIFEKVKKQVIAGVGKVRVEHRGASYLKISGQDEIDIYIPVSTKEFDKYVTKMTEAFGKPKSLYPLIRARFPFEGCGKHIDVFVINEKDKGWTECETFTNYLLSHPKDLEEYKNLKENNAGLSTREYYTRKIEFINKILKLTLS